MTQAQSKSYGGVKKKLMGAICMLLVASIMMVSSTYAWFTLSTAPEITGISTSVGANGNLEMALLPTTGNLGEIKSAVGDSKDTAGQTVVNANVTWGNLVDLSDASYGASNFVLNPARLNINDEGKVAEDSILMTAKYGTDGRVTELAANTVDGTYNADKTSFIAGNKGVRGIGVAAAMSDAQLAMRNAIAQVAMNVSSAKTTIQNSLTTNGSALATLAINYATTENYSATGADAASLNAMIDALTKAKASLGTAIQYAMMAESLSERADASTKVADYSLDDVSGYNDTISAAKTAYGFIAIPNEATTENAKDIMSALIGTDATVSDVKLSDIKGEGNIDKIASAAMSGGVVVVPGTDSPYTKTAVLTGNFTTAIKVAEIIYGGVKLTNVKATMKTNATENKMVPVAAYIAGLTAKEDTTGTNESANKITDLYGYAVDLAFRTNAIDSKLQLQVAAAQRIYSDSNEASTLGNGSYMEFTKSGLTDTQFKNLMGAVRIVFVDSRNTIVAGAKLDVPATIEENAASVKAPLKVVTVTTENKSVKFGDAVANNVITSLDQGTAKQLTVITYLDGDVVDNSMVSATSARSMTGSMNLQFASSATLVPMDYTPLHPVNATSGGTTAGGGDTTSDGNEADGN